MKFWLNYFEIEEKLKRNNISQEVWIEGQERNYIKNKNNILPLYTRLTMCHKNDQTTHKNYTINCQKERKKSITITNLINCHMQTDDYLSISMINNA